MFKKFKELEYLILAKYYFLGIVLAVLIYQFVTISLSSHSLRLDAFIEAETNIRLFASLIGGFFGGLVYLLISRNEEQRKLREKIIWKKIKEKGNRYIILVGVLACSLGFFVTGLIKAALDMESKTNFFQSLFSYENNVNYIGRILAAGLFGLFLSIGVIKRLKKMYGK
ncbi:MAG: hypothetical protein KAT14_03485, partial [Candidatus Marinimicrobia bacterium]|nr:hypothetical protein [Candidatus Neomarinimicrobiota bacterium]